MFISPVYIPPSPPAAPGGLLERAQTHDDGARHIPRSGARSVNRRGALSPLHRRALLSGAGLVRGAHHILRGRPRTEDRPSAQTRAPQPPLARRRQLSPLLARNHALSNPGRIGVGLRCGGGARR